MRIGNPIYTPVCKLPESVNPEIAELKQLWDDYYKNPTIENAQKILDFLSNPKIKSDFEAMTDCDKEKFDGYFTSATLTLTNWIQYAKEHPGHLPPKTPVDEFISDIYNQLP